ncbi:MAG TPA: hypothetical protein VGR80_09605 [Steroidobacteraceae bacterium]|nr:hypothetical protein [Steroidobacteraceae bacterium]
MTMFYVKATLTLLLAVLSACTDLSQLSDSVRAEPELQASAGQSLALSQTHDLERALMLATGREH